MTDQINTQNILIILDEFGNPHLNLEKKGTFSHFVYTAIAFKESEKENIINARSIISKKYFQGSAIKSSSISNDEKGVQKRINILKDLKKYEYVIFCLVINKSEIKGTGLSHNRVFYKFFQRIFIEKFAQNFTSFHICADKVGGSDFQRELKGYINRTAINRDLFSPERYYYLAEDKLEEPLIQLADFLCGCLGKIYCISHQQPNFEDLFELISDRLFIDFFPATKKEYLGVATATTIRKDRLVSEISVEGILNFIETDSSKYRECLEIAKYLLLIFRSAPNKLVSTKELISIVKRRYGKYTQDNLRQHIAYMRDSGLIIVSPQGKYGYKIPNCSSDLVDFYNRYLSSIRPMLRRIHKSNNLISLKTLNEVNIIQQARNFEVLSNLIDVIQKSNIE